MQEKRRFNRYLLAIDIHYNKEHAHLKKTSKTKNVSAGGVCLTTSSGPLQRGAVYTLVFSLPESGDTITTRAKVVWTKEPGESEGTLFDNGLEFIDMQDKYRAAIEEYSIGTVLEKE